MSTTGSTGWRRAPAQYAETDLFAGREKRVMALDPDPTETQEWMDALTSVLDFEGPERRISCSPS
jgi:hypothetical protein